ncbi:unnamed protein product [Bemisia tabaci]|uniref:Uncharacterized protein n=1 Tax=Bemisia tabaci TaxID=7038 RepID=A0A9P0C406_BEMTA|nr:PREDICTED: intraflagellar transport protein 27 homolog [Bemisia tabaci]CAH0752511.1 unnamed protein product [Bemisia tabaci]
MYNILNNAFIFRRLLHTLSDKLFFIRTCLLSRSLRLLMRSGETRQAKVVFSGESGVGKTAASRVIVTDGQEFPNNYTITFGVNLFVKNINMPESSTTFLIYDSTGFDLYSKYLNSYWDKPDILVLMYSVTSQMAFDRIDHWLRLAKEAEWGHGPLPKISALFANKTDLKSRRVISYEQGKELAAKLKMEYFEGSAKSNQGLNKLMRWLAQEWHQSAM